MKYGVQPVPEDRRIFNRPSNKRPISEFFEKGFEMKKDRILCPICQKDVAISFPGEIIQRHSSAIKKLNGRICSASNKTLRSQ